MGCLSDLFDMFMEEVEDGREDNITNQKYRFELYNGK